VEYALDLIRAESGTAFDPKVVDACVAVFEKGDFAFGDATVFTFEEPVADEEHPA